MLDHAFRASLTSPHSKESYQRAVFVSASHQTGLDTMSMTRRSIKVEIWGRGDRARAEARALVTMMYLTLLKVAQLKLGALRLQVCLYWTRPIGEPTGDANYLSLPPTR